MKINLEKGPLYKKMRDFGLSAIESRDYIHAAYSIKGRFSNKDIFLSEIICSKEIPYKNKKGTKLSKEG